MKKSKTKPKIKTSRIFLTDTLDKEEVEVTQGYGGILFVGNFVISNTDAKRLVRFIQANAK